MYNIIQLNDKDLSELQIIAKELGIKKTDSYKKEDLVYKILDEQAIVGATKKVAADKLKEERKEEKKKRSRVTPAKKEDKVVSATKTGEVTKTKEAATAKAQQTPKEETTNKEKETLAVETKAENAVTPKRKVGRPRKNSDTTDKKEVEETKQVASNSVEAKPVVAEKTPETTEKTAPAQQPSAEKKEKPSKPTVEKDKPAAEKTVEKKVVAKPQKKAEPVIDEESNILTGADDDDFIPIEDLPSEKIELPTELFGKFEATKTEPVQSAPEQVAQPQQQQSQSQQQRPRIVRPRDNNNANNNANNNFQRNNNQNQGQNQNQHQQRLPMPRATQQNNASENLPAQGLNEILPTTIQIFH